LTDSGTKVAANFKGNNEFKDVHLSYVDDEEVLKGISFNVKAGDSVATVSANGARKSTIINLLNRF